MEEAGATSAPTVSRKRLAACYLVMVFGLVLVLRCLWIVAYFWAELTRTECEYIFGALWFGGWLMLVGYSIAYRKRAVLRALSVFQALGLLAVVVYKFYAR